MKKNNIRIFFWNWEDINKIGKINLLKSIVVIFFLLPIVVQLVQEYKLKLTIPSSWLMLYYSTFFISLATLLYSIFCPELIKKYDTFEAFQKSGRSGGYLNRAIQIFHSRKISNQQKMVEYLSKEFSFAHHLNEEGVRSMIYTDIWNADKNSFWFVHDTLNYSRVCVRALCCILYLIGFGLLAIVIIKKVLTVTAYAIQIN